MELVGRNLLVLGTIENQNGNGKGKGIKANEIYKTRQLGIFIIIIIYIYVGVTSTISGNSLPTGGSWGLQGASAPHYLEKFIDNLGHF